MSRTRARLRQGDISRAIKGATTAGLSVSKVEIDQDGRIVIVWGEGQPKEATSPIDEWKAKHAHQA